MTSKNYFSNLPDAARIWVYQSSRAFSSEESVEISNRIQNFVSEWNSHGKEVKSDGLLILNRFIVLVVDESQLAVSGCSIDSSVSLLKSIERDFKTDLFDRMHVVLKSNSTDDIELVNFQEIEYGQFNDHLYYDNTIKTLGELRHSWLKPITEGWLSRFVTVHH